MSLFKSILKLLAVPAAGAAGAFASAVAYGHLARYRPPEVSPLGQSGRPSPEAVGDRFGLLAWNIGFTGFGSGDDFFMDGGKTVIPPKAHVLENLAGIAGELERLAPKTDFFLLQEVDEDAWRSHRQNHIRTFAQALPGFGRSFAYNLKVNFLPYPFHRPLGKVYSGLLTLSRHRAASGSRIGFEKNYAWPVSLFHVNRCFLWQEYEMQNGKKLIVVNTHKSAYDGGKLKRHQMEKMRRLVLREYEQNGNYVVVGGDWNQLPPGFDERVFQKPGGESPNNHANIAANFMPEGWQWVYERETPTNRRLTRPYKIGYTFTSIIDFYLLSPNLKVEEIRTIDQAFAWSDHQPIYLRAAVR